MTKPVKYGAPRRINSVSIFLLLVLVAAGYFGWRFFPAYLNAWTVDHILKESATQVYRANRLREPERTETLTAIVRKAQSDIRSQASVHDPELKVSLNILENSASMSADYTTIITHFAVNKTTTLHFHREETANIKTVNWDNQ